MFEEFKKKSGAFNFLLEEEFWEKWVETEFKENKKGLSKSSYPMMYLKILLGLAKMMKELNIDFLNISRIVLVLANKHLTDV